ncbi:MAG: AsmA-like C-terminal region-containing protein, partial [Candidatus Omnitrophica bacterium]|nr:AsmA-like C-terminal region-containing protein [Candidatus Omnitrophota bacterium]
SALFPELKNGVADVVIDLKITKNKNIILDINTSLKSLDISSLGLTLRGDVGIAGIFALNLTKTLQANYKFELDLKGTTLSGVYLLNEISNLNGKIKITNNGVSCEYIWGEAYNTPIRFSGGINNFRALKLNGDMQIDLELTNYKNFIPKDLKERFKDVDLQGPAEINVRFDDNLKDPQPPVIEGNIKLKEASLKTTLLEDKVRINSGNIAFKNNTFYLTGFALNYGAKDYVVDAKITDLILPDIKMKLKTNELLLTSRFKIYDDHIHILRASGTYLNSPFNIAGDIKDLKSLNNVTKGTLSLDLLDLRRILPQISEPLTKFDIKGICNLDFSINGPLKQPKDLELIIEGQSDRIGIWNFKIDEVKLNLKMKSNAILIPKFSAKPYGGTFIATMEMDFAPQNPPYSIRFSLQDLDLSKFVLDTDIKDKAISGKGLIQTNIRGYGKNLETVKGEGTIVIKGSYLWEVPLLRGLANLLFLPNLSSIIFDEASCDFVIANKNISTANLVLYSQNVNLFGEGSVNFDGTLNFLITSSISEDFIKGTSEFAKVASSLLTQAGQLIGNIKISGTIKRPEYKFIPLPLDKILKDKLKILLGGFF